MAWIKEQGLEAEVFKIQEPTVFNMLFITCTPKVAEFLKNADGVLSVGRNLELSRGVSQPRESDRCLSESRINTNQRPSPRPP